MPEPNSNSDSEPNTDMDLDTDSDTDLHNLDAMDLDPTPFQNHIPISRNEVNTLRAEEGTRLCQTREAEGMMEGVAGNEPEDDTSDLGESDQSTNTEPSWEPEWKGAPEDQPLAEPGETKTPLNGTQLRTISHCQQAEQVLIGEGDGPRLELRICYSEKHRNSCAGAILSCLETYDEEYAADVNCKANPWAPFNSKLDWEVARWAKMHGPGSTALSELLAIDGVHFTTTKEL